LQVYRDRGNHSETPRLLHNLGYVALHRGDSAQASAYFRESLGLFRQIGMASGRGSPAMGRGRSPARNGWDAGVARRSTRAPALPGYRAPSSTRPAGRPPGKQGERTDWRSADRLAIMTLYLGAAETSENSFAPLSIPRRLLRR
jgi:hypothetical protein